MLGENLMEGAWFWKAPISTAEVVAISSFPGARKMPGNEAIVAIIGRQLPLTVTAGVQLTFHLSKLLFVSLSSRAHKNGSVRVCNSVNLTQLE